MGLLIWELKHLIMSWGGLILIDVPAQVKIKLICLEELKNKGV